MTIMQSVLISVTVFNEDINSLPICEILTTNDFGFNIAILVTDNSRNPQKICKKYTHKLHYYHTGTNGGTRQAILNTQKFLYFHNNWDYVIFLDQDTSINFLKKYFELALNQCEKPAVFVPIVQDQRGEIISPCVIDRWGFISGSDVNYDTAILSGLLIHTTFINKIDYIPKVFWLDYLDHYLFKTKFPKPILMCLVMRHHLSVSNPEQVKLKRLFNIYCSELAFYLYCMPNKLYVGLFKFVLNMVRLTVRLL